MRTLAATALLLAALPAAGQDQNPVYPKPQKLRFTLEALLREEWTQDIFVPPTPTTPASTTDQDRFLAWGFPGLEANLGKFQLGVVGGFYWSNEKNYDPIPTPERDNFKSRDARLDRAFAKFEIPWLRVEGGRFTMPIEFTEMIWDRDLKPQGGALSLGINDRGSLRRLGLTVLYAKGSQIWEDETEMLAVSANAVFNTGHESTTQLVASYVDFRNLGTVQTYLIRQNSRTRPGGPLLLEYKVLDGVLRIRRGGAVPLQLVGNYCWNTAADANNSGLWLAASVGSVTSSRARLDYTYASVDKDATLAEYAADDFFWETGWQGHRGDLGIRLTQAASLHGVAQWQRFKDGPVAVQDLWVKRFRVELRFAN
jgi:Putative porin